MCAKSGVVEAHINGIDLIFGEKDKSPAKSIAVVETKPFAEQESQKISEEAQQKELKDKIIEDLEELQLTDPLAYEQIIGGDLDGGSTS